MVLPYKITFNIVSQKLDRLEAKFQKNLIAMDYNGGINLSDESKRKRAVGR